MNPSYAQVPLQYWTSEQVGQWLHDRGFNESVVSDFQRGYVTGPRLAQLSMVDIAPPLFNGDFETRNRLVGEIGLLQSHAAQAQGNQSHPNQPYIAQPYVGYPPANQPYVAQPYANQPYVAQPYPNQHYVAQPYGNGAVAIQMVPLGNAGQAVTSVDYSNENANFCFSNGSGRCTMTGNNLKRIIAFMLIFDIFLIVITVTMGIKSTPYAIPGLLIGIGLSLIGPFRIYRRINSTPDYQFEASQITLTWKKKAPATILGSDVQSIHRGRKVYYNDGDEIIHYTIRILLKSTSSYYEKTLEPPIIFLVEKTADDATSLLAQLYRVELVKDQS